MGRLYDLPTGYGALFLYLLGGASLVPAVGYMGGKRTLAPEIAEAQGLGPGLRPDEVILADAGCPGWVWPELLDKQRARRVGDVLGSWGGEGPVELWERLVALPPFEDPSERAAQVLWLQGRTASSTPLQWDGANWVMATGARGGARRGETFKASQKPLVCRGTWRGEYSAGLRSPLTVARRIAAISRTLASHRVRFHAGDLFEVLDAGLGDVVYLDPDYQGCTSYGATVPRLRLLDEAENCRARGARGARVAISEAVPLPLPGWWHLDLTRPGGKAEWLTMSHPPQHRQLRLPAPPVPSTPGAAP